MSVLLSDIEINRLIKEPKRIDLNKLRSPRWRNRRQHREYDLDFTGEAGSDFRVILRHSRVNVLDFSVILAFLPEDTNQVFRLRRYNGKSHEHSNKLESMRFYDFHIHTATERYQAAGYNEDVYGEVTDRYSNFSTAVDCLISDCGFISDGPDQTTLF